MARVARVTWALLAALVWTVFSGLAAYLAAPVRTVVILAALGGLLGSLLGERLAGGKIRLRALAGLALIGWMVLWFVTVWLSSYDLASTLLGPRGAYTAANGIRWLAQTFLLALVLRVSSLRRPIAVVAEALLLASVLARLFAGHRDGFINRPFFLVDPLWSQGIDPLPILLGIGALLAGLTVVLANSGTRRRGAARDTVVAILVIAGLFMIAPVHWLSELPKPPKIFTHGAEDHPSDLEQRYADQSKPDFNDRKRQSGNAPTAVVLFEEDYQPPMGIYYFRQRAYSLLDGGMVITDSSGVYDQDMIAEVAAQPKKVSSTEATPPGFANLTTNVCVISEQPKPMGLINADQIIAAPNPDPTRFRTAYTVYSQAPTENVMKAIEKPVGDSAWDEATRKHYLELPDDPRYAELAAEIAETVGDKDKGNPVITALITKLWLDENTVYCLKTKHARADDPVADFLFGDRTGYCVYLAQSACFLYRAQGVPARVVGGFAVPESNRGTGAALLIGGRYAHAWPEIYIDGVGWLALDVSPETSLEEPVPPPDQSLQQLLGELATRKLADGLLEERPKWNLQQSARHGVIAVLLALPPLLLVLVLVLLGLKSRHRWLALKGAPERRHVYSYRAALQRLAELGWVRQVGETRMEFARRVEPRCPTFVRLTTVHLERTLGGGVHHLEPGLLSELYRQVVAELLSDLSAVKRISLVCNPISWRRAR